MDGDGDIDVLGAGFSLDTIAWWENTSGDGTAWTEHVVSDAFNGARSVFVADVDGDGDMDVLGAADIADDIRWWENTAGDGTVWTQHVIDGSFNAAFSVVAADVDGDGDVDVLSAARFGDEVAWWENTAGDGSAWTKHTVDNAFDGALSVYPMDVDSDGDMDVLGAAQSANDITWWENLAGDGASWTKRTVDATFIGASSVYATDVDGDGDVDILGTAKSGDTVAWYENETIHRSAAYAVEHIVNGSFGSADRVYATDLDGDGDTDVVGAAVGEDAIAWWENTAGDGSVWIETVIRTSFDGATSVYATDLDGDGDVDVMAGSANDRDLIWWENTVGDGSMWTEHPIDLNKRVNGVFATDVDGDGDADIVGAASQNGVRWWENTMGDASVLLDHDFSGASAFQGVTSVHATDVDGDGDVDIVAAASISDAIAWWENKGPCVGGTSGARCTTWPRHTVVAGFDRATSVFATDMDGDGDTDVLGAAEDGNAVRWWENTGPCTGGTSGTTCDAWIEHVVDAAFNGVRSVYATDVDGDGDQDVMGAGNDANQIAWWENAIGDGTVWTKIVVDNPTRPNSVYAEDVDGDGDMDILATATSANDILWYENLGGQFALPTTNVAPSRVANGAQAAALTIDASHRGRTGDSSIELVTFELLLRNRSGAVLTDSQADGLLVELAIYLDDGSGDFDAGMDTEVTSVSSFSLTAGVLTVSFNDGDADIQVAHGTSQKYFVALTFEVAASAATPDEIRVTHLTESSSTGEDADHDLPIVLEFAADTASAVVEVNDAPVAVADMAGLLEDSGTVAGNVLDGTSGGLDTDEEGDGLTAALVTGPANGMLVGGLAANGGFTYQPSVDFNGVDSFTYTANDGFENGNTTTVTITVGAVNDVPNFTVPAMHGSDEDAGAQTVAAFATAISAGPADESGQTLTFNVTGNSDPSLFTVAPVLASDGTLTYTAAADANGTSTITVELMDDGGTANGGVDTSGSQSFDILIGAVNDVPSFDVTPSATVDQDLGPQSVAGFATAISAGPADEAGQSLTFNVTGNTNPALFSTAPALAPDGTLTFTSAPLAVGTATITVELMDDGGTSGGGVDISASQDFEIEILDAIAPEVAALDTGQGGVVEDCAELPDRTVALVVGFSEPMADPPGNGDPEDVTNPANYQLIASGPDLDLDTLGCNAVAGDDVLVPVDSVTYDALVDEAMVAFAPSLGDGIYRLFVCDSLEDPTGNALDEEVVVTFRQSASSVFRNGHFDCDLRDWIPVSTVPEEIEWSAEDVDGASVSGSVHITNLAGTAFGLGQCIDTGSSTYRIAANIRIDGAVDVLVGVTTTCEFFDTVGCTGASLGQSSSLELLNETVGMWLPVESTASVQGAASALCGFDLALLAGTLFDAYLDALVLPGELFHDGFESGDTSAWSVTVP